MEETSAEHAKISDSAYSNSCSNSQSQRSGSSKSRHSNSSESSGYCGGHPSTLASSNASALPHPISKRKDKKKKSRPAIAGPAVSESPVIVQETPLQEVPVPAVCKFADVSPQPESPKTVEVAVVELVDATDPGEHNSGSDVSLVPSVSPCLIDDTKSPANEGFCAVISMFDGVVLYTTPSLSQALGFPKGSWIGRSFIDFVHPKDRSTFTGQITNGLAAPQADNSKGPNGQRTSLFCGLRRYRGAKCNGTTVSTNGQIKVEKPVRYLPFHVTLTCRDFRDQSSVQHPKAMFLVVTALPVQSAYKAPEETIISSNFTTRHTATCHLSHCDPEVVQYFGYLPQDMVGRSLFEFYHPEDLPFIKDIYETVVKLQGTSFRSKPYRFAVQNGGYVVLETEWSSFVNPWSRKLEFVIGHHRVLKGPSDPDVFQPPDNTNSNILANISEEVLKESKIIQGEIHVLLNEVIPSRNDVTEQCEDLVSFMENLLAEAKAPELKNDVPADTKSFSEHDSVMLGEISPHHEYFDSKSSTETPPSYNQLNYNENIQRYFKSKPLTTTIYGSDEENINVPSTTDDEDLGHKTKSPTPTDPTRKCMSPVNGSGASGSGSAGNLSSGSNNQTSSASRGDTSRTTSNTTETASFKLPTLTESLLSRHNLDMEKLLVQQHRQIRSTIKSDKLKDSRSKSAAEKSNDATAHLSKITNLKRNGSPVKKGDNAKVSRCDNTFGVNAVNPNAIHCNDHLSAGLQGTPNLTMWPSHSVGVTSALQTSQSCTSTQNVSLQVTNTYPAITQMIPVYYFPAPQNRLGPIYVPQEHPGPPPQIQTVSQSPYVQYYTTGMTGVIYRPVLGAPAPTALMYRPFIIPEPVPLMQNVREPSQSNVEKLDKPRDPNRPASQATSVKAEPGSIMAMSECSKKALSPGELCSPCVSVDENDHADEDGPSTSKIAKQDRPVEYNEDESSCSSLYSSFLNKSSGSSCNPDQKGATEGMMWKQTSAVSVPKMRPAIRKPPPWLEEVNLTPELVYQYQMDSMTLQEVLEADKLAMQNMTQPLMVNDQLSQLYLDLELEGFGTKLMLDEGLTSSGSASSSSGEGADDSPKHKGKQCGPMEYGRLVMIHEENAPFPPPDSLMPVSNAL
ncbi:period circadian protein isoform X2 [Athalia rosae]|uniref:period circadian protein isoform X2 n=1 Tax=Athalia rosae TaxID=37344 RepID=UPI0020339D43|nr:period circadian protein isoform X2 [Athalia rosae]